MRLRLAELSALFDAADEEDYEDAEIADGAGELGFFSPGSWWPLLIALSASVTAVGTALWLPWLLAAGAAVPRDIAGGFVDHYLDPLGYVRWHNKFYFSWGRSALAFVDSRSQSVDTLREIQRSSIDLYATTRNLYRQSREAEIRNGEPDVKGLPDF